ncbi:hypothetical protein [Pseudoalteromonas luteoviolacea]|uniref:Uncharacterized protein n=1 Tax=Pseudoalteromonas luteoviolacea S4054 TaxID=1129367 RepID=A0A0F6AFP2_9GAMM|nr:hypothetical protein [Pseudoalteromonas luteoviolacea]AOT09303.1 hypothetical protein S4054249_16255 [Pseudoalteromonas luteoviolacea]AOT14215.1 hypothetical protein S40542_16225 [Pseudoalteromonas luteoviolacea]AOT19131.1 hypothetical protein S4054_16230 [Pseudoalteromonas luteoviolacea]KKE84978.1 hypothetical protein N479_05985 [Pseudoalteromonas luteoviolacea S4054]KZN70096.1 hypothetical protein N481_01095 [Pseudoalteromonas luteoviolacea S4047-1]
MINRLTNPSTGNVPSYSHSSKNTPLNSALNDAGSRYESTALPSGDDYHVSFSASQTDEFFKGFKDNIFFKAIPDLVSFGYFSVYSIQADHHEENKFRYGALTEQSDIDAFLAQKDRLSSDGKIRFTFVKPTKDLLELSQRLNDDELEQLAEILTSVPHYNEKTNLISDNSEDIISALSALSDDVLSSSLHVLSHLAQQNKAHDSTAPFTPVGLLNDDGIADPLLRVEYASIEDVSLMELNEYSAHLMQYIKLLDNNKMNDGQLLELNQHIDQSDFATNVGIIDMANTIKQFEHQDFFAMLQEVDKSNSRNIFAMLGQQTDKWAHTQYFLTDDREFVVHHDEDTDESERRDLHKSVLEAYENNGLSWMNEVIEFTFDTPAATHKDTWQQLLHDVENHPDEFLHSDSIEVWAEKNLDTIKQNFVQQQIQKIYEFNLDLRVPYQLGELKYIESENEKVSVKSDVKNNGE